MRVSSLFDKNVTHPKFQIHRKILQSIQFRLNKIYVHVSMNVIIFQ